MFHPLSLHPASTKRPPSQLAQPSKRTLTPPSLLPPPPPPARSYTVPTTFSRQSNAPRAPSDVTAQIYGNEVQVGAWVAR